MSAFAAPRAGLASRCNRHDRWRAFRGWRAGRSLAAGHKSRRAERARELIAIVLGSIEDAELPQVHALMSRYWDRPMDCNDLALIQIVDAAVADAARRSGDWLVCRPGCTQCCIGPFPITQLDAERLRAGMRELEPELAARIRERARDSLARIAADFPGDPATGLLDKGEEAERRFESFADDEPCPALDPQTGLCDLYGSRPITCRTFGPPVRCGPDALGACELCYHGASDAEIAACEVELDLSNLEAEAGGETIVAFVLAA